MTDRRTSTPRYSHTLRVVALVLILVVGNALAQVEGQSNATAPSAEANALTNTMCPVLTDQPVDPNISVEYEGKTIFLCCQMCRQMFLENPEQYLGNLPQFAPGGAVEEEQVASVSSDASLESASVAVSNDQGPEQTAKSTPNRLIVFAGKFHPLVIHFPIALLLTAVLADILFLVSRRPLFAGSVKFLLILAALSALAAVPMGWAAAIGARYPDPLGRILWQHRVVGTITGGLTILAAVFSGLSVKSHRFPWVPAAARITLYISAALVGVAGHLGATLIYGPGYFNF